MTATMSSDRFMSVYPNQIGKLRVVKSISIFMMIFTLHILPRLSWIQNRGDKKWQWLDKLRRRKFYAFYVVRILANQLKCKNLFVFTYLLARRLSTQIFNRQSWTLAAWVVNSINDFRFFSTSQRALTPNFYFPLNLIQFLLSFYPNPI